VAGQPGIENTPAVALANDQYASAIQKRFKN
jgi:hypothetical protein